MDNIKTWTGLSVEESIRMTEDRDKWRKYVIVWPTLGSRTAKDQILKGACSSTQNNVNALKCAAHTTSQKKTG